MKKLLTGLLAVVMMAGLADHEADLWGRNVSGVFPPFV